MATRRSRLSIIEENMYLSRTTCCERMGLNKMLSLTFALLAIGSAILSLWLNHLAKFTDNDDKEYACCGWTKYEILGDCDDSGMGPCEMQVQEYSKYCGSATDSYCDTEAAGRWWFFLGITGIVLTGISFFLTIAKSGRVGGLIGFIGVFMLVLAMLIWLGFDFDFDFNGNPICSDKNESDDITFFPGHSIFIMADAIVMAIMGSILACFGDRQEVFKESATPRKI